MTFEENISGLPDYIKIDHKPYLEQRYDNYIDFSQECDHPRELESASIFRLKKEGRKEYPIAKIRCLANSGLLEVAKIMESHLKE